MCVNLCIMGRCYVALQDEFYKNVNVNVNVKPKLKPLRIY